MSDTTMTDTTITKIDSRHSPRGAMGQKYLASGITLAIRQTGDKRHETRDKRRET